MKLMIATFAPHQLTSVKEALNDAQLTRFTVTNALRSSDEEKGHQETFRGVKTEVTLIQCVRLEMTLRNDMVERGIEAIMKGVSVEQGDDGQIMVVDLPECINIRNGERGVRAL